MRRKIVIMGAAGRDFHLFNCVYRGDGNVDVVAFTATQIPHIENRRYPPSLAGQLYPAGIPIVPESELNTLLETPNLYEVVFAYSDVSLDYINERRDHVMSKGILFSTYDIDASMLPSRKPVIAVTAVRTGCGKSQVSRRITNILRDLGKRTVVMRHPMPYGDLSRQVVQRFGSYEDLASADCTIEEREEYEPHIANGVTVYAGTDYTAVLAAAEKEADVIVWDGGNNDTPFLRPDLWICAADPYRAGHELTYFPGTENFERADLIIVGKVDGAPASGIERVRRNAQHINPNATVLFRESSLSIPDPDVIRGKRVLVVEDGPTTTHGGMRFGAGVVAARRCHAADIVDPRPWAAGEILETYARYPDIGNLLPAMGYGKAQVRDLEDTINAVDCDLVLVATPIDLRRLIEIRKPSMRIGYNLLPEDGALAEAVGKVLAISSHEAA